MELASIFFYSFAVGFTGAIMPGPLLIVDITETPRNGWKTGPIISTGHAIAEIAVVLILVLGVAAFARDGSALRFIGIVGGLALIGMGIMMAYDLMTGRINYAGESVSPHKSRKLAVMGITATLTNPYWFIWWATIGLSLVVESQSFGWIGPTVFYFGHILSDFVWYTFVSVLLWTGRSLLVGPLFKTIISVCALFLIILGGRFMFKAITGSI